MCSSDSVAPGVASEETAENLQFDRTKQSSGSGTRGQFGHQNTEEGHSQQTHLYAPDLRTLPLPQGAVQQDGKGNRNQQRKHAAEEGNHGVRCQQAKRSARMGGSQECLPGYGCRPLGRIIDQPGNAHKNEECDNDQTAQEFLAHHTTQPPR